MIVFDDVEIPWENVFFYRHTKAAAFIRATLHRYSIFPYVQRYLRFADFLLGVAYASARSTGVTMHQGVREKIAQIACYREGINAHLTAAIELAEPSPGGLLMPSPSMMYTGRVFASTQLPAVMHPVRDLLGCQASLMPSKAMFDSPGRRRVAAEVLHASGRSRPRNAASCSCWPVTCSTPTTPGTG